MSERRSIAVRFWVATAGLALLTAGCAGAQAGSATASGVLTSAAAGTTTVSIPAQAIEPGGTAVREPNNSATPAGPSTPAMPAASATPTPTPTPTQSQTEPAPSIAVVTVTETAASPAAAPAAGSADAAPTQNLNVPPAIEPGTAGFSSFQSPSGNIFCLILADPESTWVRCDISDFTYAAPTQECGPDVGFHAGSVSIEAMAPASIGGCFGDTVADPSYPVLAYGQRAVGGDISCTSTESGMTCQNLASGYGFRLAKATYELF